MGLALRVFILALAGLGFPALMFSALSQPWGGQAVTGFAASASYTGFAEPIQQYQLSARNVAFSTASEQKTLSVSVSDYAVYRYAYVSADGQAWKPVQLSGSVLGGMWLNGSVAGQLSLDAANFSLTQSRLSTGRNFIVVYSCSRSGNAWDCHSGWQIWQFNASIPGQPQGVVYAVNCGGNAYTAADGTAYAADSYFTGGLAYESGISISGTADDTLYSSERVSLTTGTSDLTYNFPVQNGQYDVTLKLAEIYYTATGSRIFDAYIEGVQAANDLDLVATVGRAAAYDVTRRVTVSDGSVTITSSSTVDHAKFAAILVKGAQGSAPDACQTASDCSDANSCTTDTCVQASPKYCTHTPISGCGDACQTNLNCDDGDPCTTDTCVQASPKYCTHAQISGCGGGACTPNPGEFLILDDTFTFTDALGGFKGYDISVIEDGPGANWKSPYDYENGLIYRRFQVISQSTSRPSNLQFGFFQYTADNQCMSYSRERLSGFSALNGPGSIAEASSSPSTWWDAYPTPGSPSIDARVDFTRMDRVCPNIGLSIPLWTDQGKQVSNGVAAEYADWAARVDYHPMVVRATIVAVPSGGTFSGWDCWLDGGSPPCTPSCAGKPCGASDGCGGTCGSVVNEGTFTGIIDIGYHFTQNTNPAGTVVYNGRIYVNDWNVSDSVYEYYMNGTFTGFKFHLATDGISSGGCSSSGNGCPQGMYYDGNNFYVTNWYFHPAVYRYSSTGTYLGVFIDTHLQGADDLEGVYFDGTYFYVLDYLDQEVYIYNANGAYTGRSWDTGASGAVCPSDILSDGTYFWIMDHCELPNLNGYIFKYFLNGTYTGTRLYLPQTHNAEGMGQNATHFFVTDEDQRKIFLYSKGTAQCG